MKVVGVALIALAAIYGTYKLVAVATKKPPVAHVLAIDGSASFASEVETCPAQLKPAARRAAENFDQLRIAAFARGALDRPWAYEVDYRRAYDDDHARGDVEFATREDWYDEQAGTAEHELERVARQRTEFGSVLLEQLERISRELADRGDRGLAVTICSDGEIIDEGVDVRKDFDRDRAVDLWLPRLGKGLEAATVRVVGFGRGLSPDENRRARDFLMTLLERSGATDVDLVPGVATGDDR